MAYVNMEAVLDRARAIIEDGAGSARVITTGTYHGDLYEGQEAQAMALRGLDKPITEVTIVDGPKRHSMSTMINSTLGLEEFTLKVRVVRGVNDKQKLNDDERAASRGAIARDVNVLMQALTWPENMTGVGLISNVLTYISTESPTEVLGEQNSYMEAALLLRGIVQVSQAVS